MRSEFWIKSKTPIILIRCRITNQRSCGKNPKWNVDAETVESFWLHFCRKAVILKSAKHRPFFVAISGFREAAKPEFSSLYVFKGKCLHIPKLAAINDDVYFSFLKPDIDALHGESSFVIRRLPWFDRTTTQREIQPKYLQAAKSDKYLCKLLRKRMKMIEREV